jgi:ribokinase
VALLEQLPEPERLRFACAAAAICVQRKGAMPSMPTRRELQELLDRA